jgi:DNA-binding NarL/FixJ family response regulator
MMNQHKPALPEENINTLIDLKANLNPKELQVLIRLLKGQMYKAIAADLCISMPMVKQYAHRLYKKLGIAGRTELLVLIHQNHITKVISSLSVQELN